MSEPQFEASEPVGDPIAPASFSTVIKRKQNFNIYTVMLIISFFCLLIGTLLLFRELRLYGDFPSEWPWKTEAGRPREVLLQLMRFRV